MKILPVLLPLLLIGQSAYPWGGEGHQAIGLVAADLLTPDAKAHVKAILTNDDLAGISTWLDDVRNAKKHHSGPLASDPEAAAFNAKFPTNASWHFVDLPLGVSIYTAGSPFASKDDVVHVIQRAVDVLEGRSTEFTPVEALRIIVHLVGDIHQPLHTVSGYYDLTNPAHPKLISDPAVALGKPNDRGGNQLFYTKSLELHAMWDTQLVKKIAADPWTLALELKREAGINKWLTMGDYHQWPLSWAGDTAGEAIKAYQGIQFGQVTMAGDAIGRIEIKLPGATRGYDKMQEPRARTQLAKAAVHLAQLLNSIHFK